MRYNSARISVVNQLLIASSYFHQTKKSVFVRLYFFFDTELKKKFYLYFEKNKQEK